METVNRQKPDNYLAWAILTTLLCCMPFGIVAIVKATQVDTLWANGNYDEAEVAAQSSKKWSIAAAVASAIGCAIYVLVVVIAAIVAEL